MIIRKEQMEALRKAYGQEFRKRVIAHARNKVVINAAYSPNRLDQAYDSCASILDPHVDVTYESYVRLTIALFFLPLDHDEVSEYVRNPMIHPNSKSKCVYDLLRSYIKRKIIF